MASKSDRLEAGDVAGHGLGAGVVRLDFVFSKFSGLSEGRLRVGASGNSGPASEPAKMSLNQTSVYVT
jgi:hypothetical protein